MSDLLPLQPNLDNIQLFLVAPDDRRSKVAQEIQRPTLSYRENPLPKICEFLPFDKLMQTIDGISKLGLAGFPQTRVPADDRGIFRFGSTSRLTASGLSV
jgi:hypothetical protein